MKKAVEPTSDLKHIFEALREFDSALLANTIGYIDPTPAHEYYMGGSIKSVTPSLGPTIGIAVTCEIDSSTPNQTADFDGFWQQLEEIKAMNVPVMWVIKAIGSRPDHECIAGDGMGKALHAAGCVGIVTDGGVRDVAGFTGIPLAVYARGLTIHHTSLRIQSVNQPVEVGGITVNPGDIVHASAEGVIKIPERCLETLPERAMAMLAFERDAHAVFLRRDLPALEKKQQVLAILAKYNFQPPGKKIPSALSSKKRKQ